MRTLTIAISERDYTRFDLPGDVLMFTDFVNVVSRELARQNLNKSVELTEKYGLSGLRLAKAK